MEGRATLKVCRPMIALQAPAKVNLTIEVLGKRPDDYHEVRTVMQSIDLCDDVSAQPGDTIEVECPALSINTADNLAARAARLLAEHSHPHLGARITIGKRIPAAGGLGGGSSDAAATLLALNRLWRLELTQARLAEIAARLGSDIPFFVHGGTALAEGRGERITPVGPACRHWLVLLLPPLPELEKKTARLYQALAPADFTGGEHANRVLGLLAEHRPISSRYLFNVFDSAARRVFPGLADYWARAERRSGLRLHLAGSGPTLFAWFTRRADADKAHLSFSNAGLKALLASTLRPAPAGATPPSP